MRHEVLPLDVPLAVGASQVPLRVDRYREKTVQLIDPGGPAFNGSLDIEGSLDGSNWVKLQTVTAAGIVSLAGYSVMWLRTHLTALTAGKLTGLFAGFDSRTDGG